MIDVLTSEWTKMRSVRSTMWTYAAGFLLMLGFALLVSISVANTREPIDGMTGFDITVMGTPFASIAMATLGVLVISSEYRTGMIRTSLQAVPQRLTLLSAKVLVFTVATALISAAATAVTFFAVQPILAGKGLDTALGDPEVLRALIGTALFLTAGGLLGLALGALIRHTPGAILSAVGLILVAPQLSQLLPGAWGAAVSKHFTTNAGSKVMALETGPGSLGPWQGFAVYLAWVAVIMIAAAVLMRRRDA
ncbi:ABC transporter permease [Nonomuraea soli]|uniref:ABC-type transport system involved in multi-copper enzyme maturation permease subunit n=1 Tax=Nonomuraea soli TaxID=1032476 RepID=A0A7W0CHK4_9ACTN|nr:ABC transporter permease [Nonomuraea soli]MBA2891289.1 ABC-type transport system involved in multi-copper enzyme maturation permease subunit [Nonomuraea soli]